MHRGTSHGESVPAERWRSVPWNRYVVFAGIALAGAATDLITKQLVFQWRGLPGQRPVWWLIDGYVGVETAVNIGAVFGMGAGKGMVFAVLSILAAIGILVWLFGFGGARQWWLTVALGCVSGGIIGNLYDRLGFWWKPEYGHPQWQSGVRDWILWQASDNLKWPNFNVADSLLVIGAGLLLWRSFFPDSSHDAPNTHAPSSGRPAEQQGSDGAAVAVEHDSRVKNQVQ